MLCHDSWALFYAESRYHSTQWTFVRFSASLASSSSALDDTDLGCELLPDPANELSTPVSVPPKVRNFVV